MSLGGGSNSSESSSSTTSRPTTSKELEEYFASLNQLTGGKLGNFATSGTAPTDYNQLTQEQLQAIGGAGATRQQALDTSFQKQQEQINSDASLTYAQRAQAQQDATTGYTQQSDAINKEVEAAMTGLASQEAMREYQAKLANAGLTARDLALISQIYFGGKGQHSSSSSSTSSDGWDLNFGFK